MPMVDKEHTEREKRLLTLIDTLNLSQKSFAEKIGVTNRALYNYLYEDRCPSPECLVKMYHLFHVNLNWVLTGEGNMFQNKEYEIFSEQEIDLIKYYRVMQRDVKNAINVSFKAIFNYQENRS